ncbi:hypothetical protein QE152_g5857 [Popillia japonica]|uniref:Uncharacterized protein n=1 Tax=Popillia japonica TaxID=7064 RepID=A0AAW1MLQ9_POPJA
MINFIRVVIQSNVSYYEKLCLSKYVRLRLLQLAEDVVTMEAGKIEKLCLSKYVRLRLLQLAEDVVTMEAGKIPKKRLIKGIQGEKPNSRPRGRCEEVVDKSPKELIGIRSWKQLTEDKEVWRRILKKTKSQCRTVEP